MARKKERVKASAPARAAEKLGQVLELPPGTLTRGAHIELSSNREALVDGCRGVLEYDETKIRLNVGDGTVQFIGRTLEIRSLTQNQAVIAGFIRTIEFSV